MPGVFVTILQNHLEKVNANKGNPVKKAEEKKGKKVASDSDSSSSSSSDESEDEVVEKKKKKTAAKGKTAMEPVKAKAAAKNDDFAGFGDFDVFASPKKKKDEKDHFSALAAGQGSKAKASASSTVGVFDDMLGAFSSVCILPLSFFYFCMIRLFHCL